MPSRTARLSKKGCGFATPECRAQRDVAVHPRPAPPPPLLAAPRLSTTALGDLEIRWVVRVRNSIGLTVVSPLRLGSGPSARIRQGPDLTQPRCCMGIFRQQALVLLRHERVWCGGLRKWVAQHGHRSRLWARATVSLRRMVALEFGTCRSGRIGG